MKEKNLDYGELIGKPKKPKVYVIQQIPGTSEGTPRINILGAREYGEFVFCLPERSQIIFSPGPLIFKLRTLLKNYTIKDYLLLTGDPVKILRYLVNLDNLVIFLVRLALGFLIVVLSSTTIRVL